MRLFSISWKMLWNRIFSHFGTPFPLHLLFLKTMNPIVRWHLVYHKIGFYYFHSHIIPWKLILFSKVQLFGQVTLLMTNSKRYFFLFQGVKFQVIRLCHIAVQVQCHRVNKGETVSLAPKPLFCPLHWHMTVSTVRVYSLVWF